MEPSHSPTHSEGGSGLVDLSVDSGGALWGPSIMLPMIVTYWNQQLWEQITAQEPPARNHQ
jgi:hypothetical protein